MHAGSGQIAAGSNKDVQKESSQKGSQRSSKHSSKRKSRRSEKKLSHEEIKLDSDKKCASHDSNRMIELKKIPSLSK